MPRVNKGGYKAAKRRYLDSPKGKVATRRQIVKRYGLTVEAYKTLELGQKGTCAICHQINSNGRALAVDHNHDTGIIRGLLCTTCNLAIGYLNDDPKLLQSALEYLTCAADL